MRASVSLPMAAAYQPNNRILAADAHPPTCCLLACKASHLQRAATLRF